MATRSFIAMETADGKFVGVYCHWDGYLENNGQILNDHYGDPKKVAKLISLGDISSLGEKIGEKHDFDSRPTDGSTTFYGRDRGETETDVGMKDFATFAELVAGAESCGSEYLYLFGRDGKWRYCDRGMQFFGGNDGKPMSKMKSLAAGLKSLAKA